MKKMKIKLMIYLSKVKIILNIFLNNRNEKEEKDCLIEDMLKQVPPSILKYKE